MILIIMLLMSKSKMMRVGCINLQAGRLKILQKWQTICSTNIRYIIKVAISLLMFLFLFQTISVNHESHTTGKCGNLPALYAIISGLKSFNASGMCLKNKEARDFFYIP